MSFFSRAKDYALGLAKSFSVPASANPGWLYGAGVALPHEPFAGAWQRNVGEAAGAGPNILAFGPVYSVINIISSDIARLPPRVLRARADGKGGREQFRKHPAWRLMRNPNPNQTMLQFLQQYMTSKLVTGNTYVLLLRDARGVVDEMYVLDPRKVQVLLGDDGSVFYHLGQDKLQTVGDPITVPARDIVHDKAVTLWHPLVGVSPLFAAGVSAMAGARMVMNAEKVFANMSRPGGVLQTPNKIDPQVAKRLQAEWDQNYSGRGLGRTAVLSNGLSFEPTQMTSVESDIVNLLRWTVEDVARVYRVPGFKLGDLNKVSYRNSEQMARDYFQGCLSYHIESFEQCFDKALELPEGIEIEFDLTPLFRMETDTRYKAHQTALQAGFKSINEVREEEDLPPVKGGDEPRVQAQYIPLSKADGTGVNVPGQTPAPPPPDPDDDLDEDDDDQKASMTSADAEEIASLFFMRLTGENDGTR